MSAISSAVPLLGRRTRLRLRTKFFLAVSALVLVISIFIVSIEQYQVRKTIAEQTSAQAGAIADAIESTAGYYVIFGLSDDLKAIAGDLAKNPAVEYAEFAAADGTILAATDPSKRPADFAAATSASAAMSSVETADGRRLHLAVRPFYESREEAAAAGAVPRGYFRIAFNENSATQAVRDLAWTNLLVILLAIGAGLLLAALMASRLVGPILSVASSATAVSNGDLTERAEVSSSDEIGDLANAFNGMALNLEKTLSKIVGAQGKLSAVADGVTATSKNVVERVDQQAPALEEAYFAIDKLNAGIGKISENVEGLSAASEETSSSILEMLSSLEEVSRHTDTLFTSVEETASATQQMVSSINEVDQNMDYLQNFITETSSAMVEMSASINQVEANAARSYDVAVSVSEAAEGGMKAVRETMEAIEQIRRAVLESNSFVARLGDRSAEIGKILNVIDDVAEQTNLLALNAAILAAQAGEQGKGFSVVAAEIRDLSERTATSTKEIATLIRAVQEEVGNVLRAMTQGSTMVEGGVTLAHDAGRALNRIIELSGKASEMGREIASATKEQSKGSETIAHSVERVRDMARQINSATSQQAAGSQHIMKAVDAMREVANYVRQAINEQRSGSSMISAAAEGMIDRVHEIFEVTTNQAKESEKIVATMERIRDISEGNRRSSADLNQAIVLLDDAIRSVDEEVRRFKVRR